jgi:hypothetical protein
MRPGLKADKPFFITFRPCNNKHYLSMNTCRQVEQRDESPLVHIIRIYKETKPAKLTNKYYNDIH